MSDDYCGGIARTASPISLSLTWIRLFFSVPNLWTKGRFSGGHNRTYRDIEGIQPVEL
ncbi:MAG TPA: hypothetical protein VJ863_10935 [Sphaerochaeta sp.]|nr:hypothetical protein [Sphaerochaeta sp.]